MKEYLIQGVNEGQVEDCLTCNCEDSLKDKLNGSWCSWFEELAIYDITNPVQPIFINRVYNPQA